MSVGMGHSIHLLTFAEVDMKFYWTVKFILTDANVHQNKSKKTVQL